MKDFDIFGLDNVRRPCYAWLSNTHFLPKVFSNYLYFSCICLNTGIFLVLGTGCAWRIMSGLGPSSILMTKICRPRYADQDMLTEYIGLALLFPCVPSSSWSAIVIRVARVGHLLLFNSYLDPISDLICGFRAWFSWFSFSWKIPADDTPPLLSFYQGSGKIGPEFQTTYQKCVWCILIFTNMRPKKRC